MPSISSVTDVADGSPAVTYSTSVVVAALNVSDEARSAYRFRPRQLMTVTSLVIATLSISSRRWSPAASHVAIVDSQGIGFDGSAVSSMVTFLI